MKIGKLLISWDRGGIPAEALVRVDEEYEKGLEAGKQLILCTLAGRSGTRFLGNIFNAHENATGITERYFEAESFYRYITYNKLPIDTAGIITLIKYGILQDWKKADIAFVNSPFFSHGIQELYDLLRPTRIVFAIGEPKFTVQSMYNKGFFEHHYLRNRIDAALGFQPAFPQKWYWLYLFARLVPNGTFYKEWETLTRIGKISWFGNKMNMDIWGQLEHIPAEKVFIFVLSEAKKDYYGYYKNLARMFGLAPLLSEKELRTLTQQSIQPWHNKERAWSALEQEEFEKVTGDWTALYERLRASDPFAKA